MKKYALYHCPIGKELQREYSYDGVATNYIPYNINEAEFIGYYDKIEDIKENDEVTLYYKDNVFDEMSKASFIAEFDTEDSKEITKALNGSKNLLLLGNADAFPFTDEKEKYVIDVYESPNTEKMEFLFFKHYDTFPNDDKIVLNSKTLYRTDINDNIDSYAVDYFFKELGESAEEKAKAEILKQVEYGGIEQVYESDYRNVVFNQYYDNLKENKTEIEDFLEKGFFKTYKGEEVLNLRGFTVERIANGALFDSNEREKFLEKINEKIKGNYDSRIINDFFEDEAKKEQKSKSVLHDIRFLEEQNIKEIKEERERQEQLEIQSTVHFDWEKELENDL